MPAPRNRRHLVVRSLPSTEAYTPHGRKITPRAIPSPSDRKAHAKALKNSLDQARQEAQRDRRDIAVAVHGATPGLYVQFESVPGVDLKLESLEDRRRGIALVAVQRRDVPDREPVELATVFVPDGGVQHFVKRFQQYATAKTKKGKPRHKDMVDRIAALRRATLRALWTDAPEAYPGEGEEIWWEVWLRRHDGAELDRLLDYASQTHLVVGERRLAFDDRLVVLVKGTSAKLSDSLEVLNDVAEVKKAKEVATFFVDETPDEQADWMDDLVHRTTVPAEEAPAVCVLDTGVTRGHPLLQDLITPADAMAVDPAWSSHDDGGGPANMGHGTEMAGLAAYGDLVPALVSGAPLVLRHRLESVKILPPTGGNPPELYGAITAQATARAEVNAPLRLRTFSLAITSTDKRDRGKPSSWSAAIDALASGRDFDPATQGLVYLDASDDSAKRLFVVSAGNVATNRLQIDHLDRSDLEPIHDPGQAWNALTVGACTDKALITDDEWDGWSPLAAPGDLSPWSTTSVTFNDTWPIKPDVVFEGGNIAHDGTNVSFPVPDLSLLSTYYKPAEKTFVLSWATSAATAQVARFAAMIQAEYEEFWPETVRALIVHSARWTRAMQAQLKGAGGKRARRQLVRRYGLGLPRLQRALRSANDSLTLVVQSRISPFENGKMREMHFHALPWPVDILQGLGQAFVRLRVTLSYFIEPNPGERGWRRRHRYASHGLRFDVKNPTESVADFKKRLNQQALEDDEDKPKSGGDAQGWFLGEQTRNRGSVHSDIWTGTAADLAERSVVGVYPVSGWWKDQPKRDRSEQGARYSLLLSIETETEDVDIWTAVAEQVNVPIEIVNEV